MARTEKLETETIRGRIFQVTKLLRRCASCGAECENSQDEDWRLSAYARYRAETAMVTPEAMVAFRGAHGLLQEDIAGPPWVEDHHVRTLRARGSTVRD